VEKAAPGKGGDYKKKGAPEAETAQVNKKNKEQDSDDGEVPEEFFQDEEEEAEQEELDSDNGEGYSDRDAKQSQAMEKRQVDADVGNQCSQDAESVSDGDSKHHRNLTGEAAKKPKEQKKVD
jgi:hypothetical protein